MRGRREEEAAKKRGMGEDERASLVPVLRKVAREEYLKQREEKKLEELRDMIEDEKYLFEGQKLTRKEREEFEYKQRIYDLAVQRAKDVDNIVEYR